MNQYSVLLVDDEEDVIQVIMKKIDWEGLGFRIAGYAHNGIKALEMVEENQVDVVVTDIKMPYMDGLELSRRLKKEFPATKILLFTGFDEFEYAKEAVHLEVEEYILKPVNAAELTEILTRLRAALDRERDERANVEKLRKYYMDSLPLLRTNFFTSLIDGQMNDEQIRRSLADYQIGLTGPWLTCVVIHTSTHEVPPGMTPLLLAISVRKQAEERFTERWRASFFDYKGDIVMLTQLRSADEASALTDECDRFARSELHLIGARVTCGIGIAVQEPSRLRESYGSAREAVSYRVLYGTSRAINIREISPDEHYLDINGDEDLRNLFKRVIIGPGEQADRDEVVRSIEQAVDHYVDDVLGPIRNVGQYQMVTAELVGSLYRFAQGHGIRMTPPGHEDADNGEKDSLFVRVQRMEKPVLKKWLLDVSLSFHEALSLERSSNSKTYVRDAKRYVSDHFDDPELSLDSICRTLGVSNSYFSSTFKKETGGSFISYLTDIRMKQAARFLIETDDKNYVVARKVGYTDANYFSYVFKKTYGMSPSRYRSEHADA